MKTGFHETLLSLIAIVPYRCRGCRKRFFRFGSPPSEREVAGENEAENAGDDVAPPSQ